MDIALLDYQGYKLAERQQDLTPLQRKFLVTAYPNIIQMMDLVKQTNRLNVFSGELGVDTKDTESMQKRSASSFSAGSGVNNMFGNIDPQNMNSSVTKMKNQTPSKEKIRQKIRERRKANNV